MLLTADVQVTVVDGHIPGVRHVAPGSLGIIVGVTALVCGQSDFWDELLVFAESLHHGRWPRQTHVASYGHTEVAGVVQAVLGQTCARFDSLGGDGGRLKYLTLRERRHAVWGLPKTMFVCFLGRRCDITTNRDFASLLLDRGVSGETPRTLWIVVRIPTEILLQNAVRLGGVELPAVG